MKKLFSLTLCLLCMSYAFCQKSKGVELEKLKTTYMTTKNHDNAVAYMSALEKVGGQEAEILSVMDTLFAIDDSDKFSDKTWYFFDRYATDFKAPIMKNILLDKYWANRFWSSEKINNKITKLSMEMVADIYSNKEMKYSKEFLENHITMLNSFDLSEFDNLGLCAYLMKLRLDENFSYAISVVQFAIPNVGDDEWVKVLDRVIINCGKLSKDTEGDMKRVEDHLNNKVLNHFISADKYLSLAKSVK